MQNFLISHTQTHIEKSLKNIISSGIDLRNVFLFDFYDFMVRSFRVIKIVKNLWFMFKKIKLFTREWEKGRENGKLLFSSQTAFTFQIVINCAKKREKKELRSLCGWWWWYSWCWMDDAQGERKKFFAQCCVVRSCHGSLCASNINSHKLFIFIKFIPSFSLSRSLSNETPYDLRENIFEEEKNYISYWGLRGK